MKCGKPATHTYVWAGEVVKQCEEHARMAEELSRVMGWPFTVSAINDGSVCESEVAEKEAE